MFTQSTILVVEDQLNERQALARMLRSAQYNVIGAESAQDALAYLQDPIGLVITDLRMEPFSGLDLLRRWKQRRPQTPFIVMTAYAEVGSAVEAMKLGASEYMIKPVNPDQLLELIGKCLEASRGHEFVAQGSAARTNGESASDSGIGIPPGTSLEDLEKAAVEQALAQHHGNRTHAARTLGISVRTLQRKLKAWQGPMLALHAPAAHNYLMH